MTTTDDEGGEPTGRTRPSLLLRLRDPADGQAWRLFVETYTPLVFGYCRRRGLQTSDAADVAQEVMAQVSRSISGFTYQPQRGRFRDWLGAVTRTKLLRFLRRDGRAGKGGGGEADEVARHIASPESDTQWSEGFQARVLEVAMARVRPGFEPGTWRAFERSWVDDQSAAAVASELGVPVDHVYVAKSRVLKRLREEVAALAEEFPFVAGGGP